MEKRNTYLCETEYIDFNHPLIEKIFGEYAPKYDKRAEALGQKGGYTRIVKLANRRGDDANKCILELVD